MCSQTIKEKIRQRRSQMLVHSCLYYEMDESIVDDYTWQKWADELTTLQTENPDDCAIDFYDEHFKDWNGATGAFLPLTDPKIRSKAEYILRISENNNVQIDQNVVQYTGTLEEFIS